MRTPSTRRDSAKTASGMLQGCRNSPETGLRTVSVRSATVTPPLKGRGPATVSGMELSGLALRPLASLEQVQPPVLPSCLLHRRPHPLGEQDAEQRQADEVTGGPEQAAGQVLVVERVR